MFVFQTILKIPGFTDNIVTHILSGLGAGFFAVCIGSPVDVVWYLHKKLDHEFYPLCFLIFFFETCCMAQVKSRMMGDPSYKGTIDCFVKTLKADVSNSLLSLGILNITPENVYKSWVFVSYTGSYGILQGFHPQLWTSRLMERHHVFDPRTGKWPNVTFTVSTQ